MKSLIRFGVVLMLLLAVSGLFAQNSPKVTLTWQAPAEARVSYNVYRINGPCPNTTINVFFKKLNTDPVPSGTLTFTDASALPPGDYCYFVTSVLNGFESLPSNPAPATIINSNVPLNPQQQ